MRITRLLKFTALCTAVIALGSCNKTPMFGKVSIDKIIKELTLEEKADLFNDNHLPMPYVLIRHRNTSQYNA